MLHNIMKSRDNTGLQTSYRLLYLKVSLKVLLLISVTLL